MPTPKKHLGSTRIGGIFEKLLHQTGSPVHFKLPRWCNYDKDKPVPYAFIRRNVYLVKKIKKRLEDDGIFCACHPSPGSSGVCSKDCHCGMLLSSCSSGCKCGDSCVNKPFQSRHMKKLKLVETEKCGSGIVADEVIQRGEFIIEYVGEVIDDKICEERLWKMKHQGETNFYLCEINRDMVIDATYQGNKSRYINHSCSPNSEMQKWIIDGETRIGIFATCDIKKGEHLTYDYQYVSFTGNLFTCAVVLGYLKGLFSLAQIKNVIAVLLAVGKNLVSSLASPRCLQIAQFINIKASLQKVCRTFVIGLIV